MKNISIIIPVRNNQDTIKLLVNRINETMETANIAYEIIFIDDKSTDKTAQVISFLSNLFPVSYIKKGRKGKGLLREGLQNAKYEVLCIIDTDLQHSLGLIPEMLRKIENNLPANQQGPDFIIKREKFVKAPVSSNFIRKFSASIFRFNSDSSIGIELFKREVFEKMKNKFSLHSIFTPKFIRKVTSAGFIVEDFEINDLPQTDQSAPTTKQNYRQVLKIIRKIFLTAAVVWIIVNAALLLFQNRQELVSLTAIKPDAFTELYFENNENLPVKISHSSSPLYPHPIIDTYSFRFTIHNLENRDERYSYEVYALEANKVLIDQRSVSIKNKDSKTVGETFLMPDIHPRTQIVVYVKTTGEQIDFWMPLTVDQSSLIPVSKTNGL